MLHLRTAISILLLSAVAAAGADLSAAMAETNLEKRSAKALDNAEEALLAATAAYRAGDFDKMKASIEEVKESVDLAYKSLQDSGKKPRSSKYYKNAEIRTRELGRRLGDFSFEVGLDERPIVDEVRKHVLNVHDSLLFAIMSKKK